MKDAKEDAPGAHGFAVLMGHQARELMQVGQVVRDPGCQQLP